MLHVLILAFFLTCVSNVGGFAFGNGGLTHDFGNGWSGTIRGTVDTNGNLGVSIGVGIRFKKRSTDQKKYFKLSFDVNPCNFNLYDANRDDFITKDELVAVFGDNKKTTELFDALDMLSGDGKVDRDEFLSMTSKTVEGC